MTDKKDVALKLALEALRGIAHAMPFPVANKTIEAIKEALYSIYTTPPASKPLTDEEISRIWMLNGGGLAANRYHDFARAIEAAHGITGEHK